MSVRPTPLRDRFFAKVPIAPSDQCWFWRGGTGSHGYGVIRIAGKSSAMDGAHRVSYQIHKGPIPRGLFVCHHCDNPGCVNPSHLFLGTVADNSADMAAKGRSTRGEKSKSAKLTEAQALEILHAPGTLAGIARRYGVSPGHVSDIKSGRKWKHIASRIRALKQEG